MGASSYIDGRFVEVPEGTDLPVENPSTGQMLATLKACGRTEAAAAVAAARRAFDEGTWSTAPVSVRAAALTRLADELEKRREVIVDLLVDEAGAPARTADVLQFQLGLAMLRDMADRVLPQHVFETPLPPVVAGGAVGQGFNVEEPVGVASLITAYNFPFYLTMLKLAPALAAGCTVVHKPSELTPLVGLTIAEAADAAGLPPGVVNVVVGREDVGEELTTHADVDLVSFTGSLAVGRTILRQASTGIKRVVLELGGKSPAIVLPDADLDAAAAAAVGNLTTHAGQGCVLHTRILAHRDVAAPLRERILAGLSRVVVGDARDPGTTMGPLVSRRHLVGVQNFLDTVSSGATVETCGSWGARPDGGHFLLPSLVSGIGQDDRIAREEIFGPVGVLLEFDSVDEAITMANDSCYGLGAGVWSSDAATCLKVARSVRAGVVKVNGGSGPTTFGPFGGFKQSGLGREVGHYGLQEYLETKSIQWRVM